MVTEGRDNIKIETKKLLTIKLMKNGSLKLEMRRF